MNYLVLGFTKLTGYLPALLFFRPKVTYINKKRQSRRIRGAAILMSNHKFLMDFVLHLMLFPTRTLHFLVAEVLYQKNALLSWLLRSLGSIKVDRTAYDFAFIAEAVQLLDKGHVVGVFPEGQLPRTKELGPFRPSTVMIALSSGAPIIPVYTQGNYCSLKRTRVIIGEPIQLRDYCSNPNPSGEEIDKLNTLLRERILELGRRLYKE